MKKIMLLLLVVVILSGCSIKDVTKTDFKSIQKIVLNKKIKNYNTISRGYKYYSPKGIVIEDSNEYNDTLRRDNNRYYLYVDIVSYYKKMDLEYKENKKLFYSKKIDKNGYLNITKMKDKYFIEMLYNYAKIESYVNKADLNIAINDISVILSSIQFNDLLLKKMYEEGGLDSKEESFNILAPKKNEDNFLKSIEENDKYQETTIKQPEEIVTTTTAAEEIGQ